ncbi:MAG: tRNA pseudouridine(38-40) synthase TruA, partial [Lachnospiraceae bacterium]|nr:tRNA pseudouridine(38-40) synthase TruA [Lachnospiraceae bacterium]
MKRVMLTVAYDGTDYCGWQIQPNGPTIEGELNKHLSKLLGEEISVIGASRTDSGVHALCNIAVFDTNARMDAGRMTYALNQRLPMDIRIQKSREVAPDFHPRHCNSKKTYEYRIYNAPFENPITRRYAYFVYFPLDIERMQRAAAYLVGEHDFKSFCVAKAQVATTVRTIYDIRIDKEGDYITIRISGNGFLFNMVRIIVGTLVRIGRGVWEPERMEEILEARDRQKAGPTAP